MNRVVWFLLGALPALLACVAGSVCVFQWIQDHHLGILRGAPLMAVGVGCFVTALVYLIVVGACIRSGRCSKKPVYIEQEDDVEFTE